MLKFVALRRPTPSQARQLCALYRGQGWWASCRARELLRVVRGSHCFMVAAQGTEIVGMGRAISDGASDAYIQDVMVRPDHRGLGIGSAIVAFLRERCLGEGVAWVGLIAAPGTQGFYERLGFRAMEAHVPMLLGNPGMSR